MQGIIIIIIVVCLIGFLACKNLSGWLNYIEDLKKTRTKYIYKTKKKVVQTTKKIYTWKFDFVYNPVSVTAVANSVGDARKIILTRMKTDKHKKNMYNRQGANDPSSMIFEGSWCKTPVIDSSITIQDTHQQMTLEKYIKEYNPNYIKNLKDLEFVYFSCLDG
jgi:hypothetical protein